MNTNQPKTNPIIAFFKRRGVYIAYKNWQTNNQKMKHYHNVEKIFSENNFNINDISVLNKSLIIDTFIKHLILRINEIDNSSINYEVLHSIIDGLKIFHHDYGDWYSQFGWDICGRNNKDNINYLWLNQDTVEQTVKKFAEQLNNILSPIKISENSVELNYLNINKLNTQSFSYSKLSNAINNIQLLYLPTISEEDGIKNQSIFPNLTVFVNKFEQLYIEQIGLADEKMGYIEGKIKKQEFNQVMLKDINHVIPYSLLGIVPQNQFINKFDIMEYKNKFNYSLVNNQDYINNIGLYKKMQSECLLSWNKEMIAKLLLNNVLFCLPIYDGNNMFVFSQYQLLLSNYSNLEIINVISEEFNTVLQNMFSELNIDKNEVIIV